MLSGNMGASSLGFGLQDFLRDPALVLPMPLGGQTAHSEAVFQFSDVLAVYQDGVLALGLPVYFTSLLLALGWAHAPGDEKVCNARFGQFLAFAFIGAGSLAVAPVVIGTLLATFEIAPADAVKLPQWLVMLGAAAAIATGAQTVCLYLFSEIYWLFRGRKKRQGAYLTEIGMCLVLGLIGMLYVSVDIGAELSKYPSLAPSVMTDLQNELDVFFVFVPKFDFSGDQIVITRFQLMAGVLLAFAVAARMRFRYRPTSNA